MKNESDNPEVERMKALLKEVYAKGFNVYACLNRLRRKLKRKDYFPVEVVTGVCNQYLKDPGVVKSEWPWFLKAIRMESGRYYASLQEQGSIERHKNRGGEIDAQLRDLIAGIGK